MDGKTQTVMRKPLLLHKINLYAHAHQRGLLFAAALAIIVGTGLTVLAILYTAPVYEPSQASKVVPPVKKELPKFYSSLTGVEVVDEASTKRQVTAIMIENSPDARPQSGLKAAGMVYEAIAEGGITRFLALYQEAQPELIGPVRSLRPYYVDWLAPYDAAVAHVGGSKNALDEVRNGTYKDIDQFFNAGAYWRANDRYAPHNVYTSFERLNALNQAKGFNGSSFQAHSRKADAPSKQPNATAISVPISSGTYNSNYTYDAATNSYLRFQGGEPHNDREAGHIAPKVVVVLKVPTQRGFEDGYREQMTTVGSGAAVVFQDGIATDANWTKADKKSIITLTDTTGKSIALNAGQTWYTAIAAEKSPTWQ